MSFSASPKLFLAPMEGVGNRAFRTAMATIGGFDEACTEFLRVPKNAHIPSLAAQYNPHDTAPIPQAAQIMGSSPELMAEMTSVLFERGAHRVELNCGCPSNTVTGRGAGSSLLKEPMDLFKIARAMVQAASVPISIKLRSGFEDTTLLDENLLAAQEAGVSLLTLHPRTKRQGYTGSADWSLISRAKELLNIPVVGNGDIKTAEDALRMLDETRCDALMIGRGAITNPWIFHEIKEKFGKPMPSKRPSDIDAFFSTYLAALPPSTKPRSILNQLKQLAGFLFLATPDLQAKRQEMLRFKGVDQEEFLMQTLPLIHKCLVR